MPERETYDEKLDRPPPRGRGTQPVRTVLEMERSVLSIPPTGSYLWERTRQIEPEGHMESCSGRLAGFVYYIRNDKTFVRAFTQPRDPKSEQQLRHRTRFRAAHHEWKNLTAQQRMDWTVAAIRLWKIERKKGGVCLRDGQNLFVSCQLHRQAAGLPMQHTAPGTPADLSAYPPPPAGLRGSDKYSRAYLRKVPLPSPVTKVTLAVAPGNPGLTFAVRHNHTPIADCWLLVEMTPPTKSPAHPPVEVRFTKSTSADADSYLPLAPSGAQYQIPAPRYAITPGQRFGLRLTIITHTGLSSPRHTADLVMP